MTSRRSLLYEGYADSYEEPHRRRPTAFNGPVLTAVNAYYYPNDPQMRESFIERILRNLGADSPHELARALASYHSYGPRDDGADLYRLSTPQVIDNFKPAKSVDGRWRVEVHREYISIALFVPFQIVVNRKAGMTSIRIRHPGVGPDWVSRPARPNIKALIDLIYNEAREVVGNEFDDIADNFHSWCEHHDIGESCKPKLFADFFGCCVPWTYFGPALPQGDCPAFPDPQAAGLTLEQAALASEQSGRFLRQLTAGAGSTLLGGWPHDCVACYMQNGHSIYVSNIGKRQSETDEQPLNYLVLYADAAAPPGPGATDEPPPTAAISACGGPRLSRFVGRIHDVGLARLAALRNMRRMREFNNALRIAEFDLQSINPAQARTRQLRLLEERIEEAARTVGESVHHRSLRASYYLGQLQRIADDLSIIDIVGFQDYRQFVRRNLYQSIENIVAVGRRYQSVLEQLSTKHNAANSINLLHIQRIADIAASVIIIYYMLSIPSKIGEYIGDVGGDDGLKRYLALITLLLAVIVYLLMALRVYRLADEINRERKGRQGRTSMMIWAARIFALPYLLRAGVKKVAETTRKALGWQPKQP